MTESTDNLLIAAISADIFVVVDNSSHSFLVLLRWRLTLFVIGRSQPPWLDKKVVIGRSMSYWAEYFCTRVHVR